MLANCFLLVAVLVYKYSSDVKSWHTCSLSSATAELLLFGDHSLDAVVHVLDEVDLRATKAALVRDVVHVVSRLRVLAVNATNLNVELVGDLLELSLLSA